MHFGIQSRFGGSLSRRRIPGENRLVAQMDRGDFRAGEFEFPQQLAFQNQFLAIQRDDLPVEHIAVGQFNRVRRDRQDEQHSQTPRQDTRETR